MTKTSQLLSNPDISSDERQEVMKTLRSFVSWMEFRVAGEHE